MGHTLKLELSEDVYTLLKKLSEKAGQMPENLAAQWVVSEARKHADDPLEKFIGKFKLNNPDWADNHDAYLGEILKENMKTK
ncbi:MAG: hypothetical protein ACLFRG_02215 [Desulfococcaceae bacterium]